MGIIFFYHCACENNYFTINSYLWFRSSLYLQLLGVTGGTFGIPVSFGVFDCLSDQYTTLWLFVGLELVVVTQSVISSCRPEPLIVVNLETSGLLHNKAVCCVVSVVIILLICLLFGSFFRLASKFFLNLVCSLFAARFWMHGMRDLETELPVCMSPIFIREGRSLFCRLFNLTFAWFTTCSASSEHPMLISIKSLSSV